MPKIQTVSWKNLQTVDMVSEYWNDINGELRWKLIRGWPYQHFIKIL